MQEYEKVAHPQTLQEMMARNEEIKLGKADRIVKRELTIATNITKLQKWTDELLSKRSKKEEEGETISTSSLTF